MPRSIAARASGTWAVVGAAMTSASSSASAIIASGSANGWAPALLGGVSEPHSDDQAFLSAGLMAAVRSLVSADNRSGRDSLASASASRGHHGSGSEDLDHGSDQEQPLRCGSIAP